MEKRLPSFNRSYFDNKTGDALRKTITPDWETTERHLHLLKVPDSASRILEIGCGIGRLLKELHDERPGRHCVGFDASDAMIAEGQEYAAGANIDILKCGGDGDDLTGFPSYFDFAYSLIVFQHIPHTETVKNYITAMVRMLKPGGTIRFQVLSEDYNKGHLWSYHDIDALTKHLSSLGLSGIQVDRMSRWTFFTAQRATRATKKVLFLGPGIKGTDEVWGGSVATSFNFIESMKLSDRFEVTHVDRKGIKTPDDLRSLLAEASFDILHVDDAGIGAQLCYAAGVQPDVIGPISRAPNGVKQYRIKGEIWDSIYTPEWFYSSVVIRLNANEERAPGYADKYRTISQGVDTSRLRPPTDASKARYVLWAGDAARPAKNFELMQEIMRITTLPEPYEFKVMSGYKVEDYWDALDEAVLLINTSKYESFCAALFEAKAKGVPTIYRQKLHNDRFPDGQIQVPYTADGYRDEILSLLGDKARLEQERKSSRAYCDRYASFEVMKNSYEEAYDAALSKRALA